jgi:hypothetical protein
MRTTRLTSHLTSLVTPGQRLHNASEQDAVRLVAGLAAMLRLFCAFQFGIVCEDNLTAF